MPISVSERITSNELEDRDNERAVSRVFLVKGAPDVVSARLAPGIPEKSSVHPADPTIVAWNFHVSHVDGGFHQWDVEVFYVPFGVAGTGDLDDIASTMSVQVSRSLESR
jgi:hypothetical protein